jgi:hypothetical protein
MVASAFEQTTVAQGAAAQAQAVGEATEQPLPGVELTVPSKGAQTGATLTIPGFGSIISLPKLDFGLELLYGSPEAKIPGEIATELPPDALTVYGSVKKTF